MPKVSVVCCCHKQAIIDRYGRAQCSVCHTVYLIDVRVLAGPPPKPVPKPRPAAA